MHCGIFKKDHFLHFKQKVPVEQLGRIPMNKQVNTSNWVKLNMQDVNTNFGIKSQYTILHCKSNMAIVMQTALGSAYFVNKSEIVPISSVMTRHTPGLSATIVIITVCITAFKSCYYDR